MLWWKVTKCGKETEPGWSYGGVDIVPLPVSIKDRSLTALLSCWTDAPLLAGRISRSDREAKTLSRPGIGPMYALYWCWFRRTTRARRATLVYLGYLGHLKGSLGMGGAYRTHELVLDSVTRWPVAHLMSECGLCGTKLASWLEIDLNRHRSWIVSTWLELRSRSKDYGTLWLQLMNDLWMLW